MTKSPTHLELYATLATARTYQFYADSPLHGWAYCTVNDHTGELLIVSDWGNWSHLWNPKHLGRDSLTHFIADRRGYDYLACKLLGGQRAAQVLDAEATIAQWRQRLLKNRLQSARGEGRLSASLAREIWDQLGDLRDDANHESHFIEHAYQIEGFTVWVTEEPWEDTVHRPGLEYLALVEIILPALANACAAAPHAAVARACAHYYATLYEAT